jgi:hypothetical protein
LLMDHTKVYVLPACPENTVDARVSFVKSHRSHLSQTTVHYHLPLVCLQGNGCAVIFRLSGRHWPGRVVECIPAYYPRHNARHIHNYQSLLAIKHLCPK